ncbi:MAG TPA: ASKHA domain-containing protein, partial [Anaerolineaceae bacterium]|nr:ASKHA domain-containing protein [Anaerolineaceae bacterium]
IGAEEVDRWIIAGAFGTFLDLSSAVRIGMFPDVPLERYHQVGNAAGAGAKMMLLSKKNRAAACQLAGEVNYIELTIYPGFTDSFIQSMYFSQEKSPRK